MSFPTTSSNPWATQFRASLFADEDSPLDALGEAVESLGFGWLEGYMAQIFEGGEACEGKGGEHDGEHVPALGDLIKTPSRKKGTTTKKTRAKAAADKDKINKLAALNKQNASEDRPTARPKGNLFAPVAPAADPVPFTSASTSAPTSTAAITVATVGSQTPSKARIVKVTATSPTSKPLSPSKHPLPSSVPTSPFRPPLGSQNSSHTNVPRAASPLVNRSPAKGDENASSLMQRLVGSTKKASEHDEGDAEEEAEKEVVVPVVKKKATSGKAAKTKAGGKKKKEKVVVPEEKEEEQLPEVEEAVEPLEVEQAVAQQVEDKAESAVVESMEEPAAIALPLSDELESDEQPIPSSDTSLVKPTISSPPPQSLIEDVESVLSPPQPVEEEAVDIPQEEEEVVLTIQPEAVASHSKSKPAEVDVDEEEMEDGEIVENTLDEIEPAATEEEQNPKVSRLVLPVEAAAEPAAEVEEEEEEEEEIEAEDQEFAAPRSPIKPLLSSSFSATAAPTTIPASVPFPVESGPLSPKPKEVVVQEEEKVEEEEEVQIEVQIEEAQNEVPEAEEEEEEEEILAEDEADIPADRSQSPVILDEEALLKEETAKQAAAPIVDAFPSSTPAKVLSPQDPALARSTASDAPIPSSSASADLTSSQTVKADASVTDIASSQSAEREPLLTTSTIAPAMSAEQTVVQQPVVAHQSPAPEPAKPSRPVRSSWLNKALGGGAPASVADHPSDHQLGGLRKSHGAALVAASREREKEHQLQATSASSSMLPPPRPSTALKRKSGEAFDASVIGGGAADLDSTTRSTKLPKLSDPCTSLHPFSSTLPTTTTTINSRSTAVFSPPPGASTSLHADNQTGIDRVRKAVEELSAKAARSRGLSSMGLGGFGGSAAQLPYVPRDSSVPATRLPGGAGIATAAAAIVAEAAAVEAVLSPPVLAAEPEPKSAVLIAARAQETSEAMDDARDYEEEQLPSLPSLPSSPRRSSDADEQDYPESSSAFPSSLASLVDQIDDQLSEPLPPPAPVDLKKLPIKHVSPPISRPRTPPPSHSMDDDTAPLGSTTPAASPPPPAPIAASSTIPKSSKITNLAQSFAGSSNSVEKGDLTLEDLEVPPKKSTSKKGVAASSGAGGKGKGKRVDEDDLHDAQMMNYEEEELIKIEQPQPKTTRVTRAALNSSISQSNSNNLESSTSNARLASSTSGQPSIYAQGSTFAAKALGKSAKAGPVKSLQLAAEAQKKEAAQKERKAAMSKLAEAQRMRALAEKQKEEKDRAEEEKRQRNAELADRKARAAELEKKRRDREEKERKAKELSKSQAAPEDDGSKKRKVAPDSTSKSTNDPKRFASSTSTKPQASSSVKQLAKPPASAGLPAKVVVPSFRHLPQNAAASSSTSNQQQQRSSNILANSTIRMVGGGLGPPVRPSEVGKMGGHQQQQQHRPSQAQGASVLAAQRQMLQNHINAQNEELPGQSEAIELPEIKSEYSDSDDEDRPKSTAPQWAQSPEIRSALREQELHNPDEIFGPMRPLNMEETFRARAGKFRARSSSANWGGQDRLTPQEELDYARRMGFVSQAAQSGLRQAD